MRTLHIIAFITLVFVAAPLMAQPQVNPVVFTRSTVTILSIPKPQEKQEIKDSEKPSSDEKEKAKEDNAKKSQEAEKEDESVVSSGQVIKHYFNVEVRNPDALSMEWFYTLAALKQKEGVMIVYNIPEIITLEPAKIYKAIDVVFIDEEGIIRAIAPNIVLSGITKAVQPDEPMKAMMFLKGGVTQDLGISPGDTVVHPAFISAPVILN